MVVYSFYPNFLHWENASREDDVANLGLLTFYITTALGIGIWIIFYYWFYKAYKNLKLFYAKPLRHSPGTALVYFFVPIVNIWETYFNVRELWKYSDPNVLPSGEPIKYKPEKNIVKIWWISVLLLSILLVIGDEILIVGIISDSLYVFTLIMWFLIIREVTLRQEEKNNILYSKKSEFKK